MTEENTFPFFIHMVTIPLTLGFGFFLGWVLRGATGRRGAAARGRDAVHRPL